VLQNEPKDILENFDGLSLESFAGLYNKVGFVNGEKYWLSEDKKWAIYTCTDKNWIVGSVQALGTPKDVNAWIYTSVSKCPFIGNTSINYWDDDQRGFVEETNLDNIQIECVKNDENQKQNIWFETMSKEKVDILIQNSSDEELCGRRPWTNIEKYQKLYQEGHVQGFSGIPFGPNNHPASPYSRRKKRIVNGGAANYGEWPWQIRMLQFKKYKFFCGGSYSIKNGLSQLLIV